METNLIIYRDSTILAEPSIDLQTEFNEVLMGVDEVRSMLISSEPILFQLDDYIIFRNENFTVNEVKDENNQPTGFGGLILEVKNGSPESPYNIGVSNAIVLVEHK